MVSGSELGTCGRWGGLGGDGGRRQSARADQDKVIEAVVRLGKDIDSDPCRQSLNTGITECFLS